jgi:TatD DNase family protein
MGNVIDSHVHLNHEDFAGDFDEVIARARAAGVTHVVNIGFDLESSRETLAMTRRHDFMYGAVGVHPHDAKTYNGAVEDELESMLQADRIIAVGEIGLDYYRDLSPRDIQRDVFVRQIEVARRANKPIIIHCRDAFDDVITTLSSNGDDYRGIFHAFSGDSEAARRVLDLGFHIGIGGVITFKKSTLSDVVADLPPDRIVLETDCPYLTPAPYRGKRNEPSYLQFVVAKIAEATGRDADEVMAQTDTNFKNAMTLEV